MAEEPGDQIETGVEIQAGLGEVVFTPGPDEALVFANVAQVMISGEDVCLYFGLRNPLQPLEVVGKARIYCTIPHFKRLANAFNHQIVRYEKVFGEVDADPVASLVARRRPNEGENDEPRE